MPAEIKFSLETKDWDEAVKRQRKAHGRAQDRRPMSLISATKEIWLPFLSGRRSRRKEPPLGDIVDWRVALTSAWERTFAVITVRAHWPSDEADPRDLLVPADQLAVAPLV